MTLLDDVHEIADKFLRDYTKENPQPIAESILATLHVNLIRPDGKLLVGVKRDGTSVWSRHFQFAKRIPSNVMQSYMDQIGQEVLPIWAQVVS